MMNYKTKNDIVYACKYHIVWCPKYRRKVLVDNIAARLKELIKEVCGEMDVDIIEMGVKPDHVHLIVELCPQCGVHKVVKAIKRRTAGILREEFHELCTKLPCLWTNSYFIATVGEASQKDIQIYVQAQKTSQRQK